jgi:hypothetical protein
VSKGESKVRAMVDRLASKGGLFWLLGYDSIPEPEFVVGSHPAYWNPALVRVGCG